MSSLFVLKDAERVENCITYLRWISPAGQHVKIEKPKRSVSQNSYFHKLVSVIATYTGDPLDEVKMRIKYAVLPLKEVFVKGVSYQYPLSTRDLKKDEFSPLIEAALMIGADLGLEMPTPHFFGVE